MTAENDRARTSIVRIDRRFIQLFISSRRSITSVSSSGLKRLATLRRLVLGPGFNRVGVHDATKRQRHGAALTRARQRLRLFRLQFKRYGFADHGGLAIFLFWRLVDSENADIAEDDLGTDDIGRAAVRILLALRKDDIDPVVRQNKAAGAGLRRNFGGDSAHSGRQNRGHEARAIRLDQLRLANRLAGNEWCARDRAGNLGRCIGTIVTADKAVARSRRRPRLPLHSLCGHRLAKTDVGLRNENVHGLQRDRLGGGRLLTQSTREICGNAAGKKSDGQDDDACGIHTLLLSTFTRLNCLWVQLLLQDD